MFRIVAQEKLKSTQTTLPNPLVGMKGGCGGVAAAVIGFGVGVVVGAEIRLERRRSSRRIWES